MSPESARFDLLNLSHYPADALLDLPVPHEDQKQALIRQLERERGPVIGSWQRPVATELFGARFQDGSEVVLEREAHPRGTWSIAPQA
jgi:hypothetical protein